MWKRVSFEPPPVGGPGQTERGFSCPVAKNFPHPPTPFLSDSPFPLPFPPPRRGRLSVRLLEAGTGAGTAKLLGLAATVVGDKQGAVELDEGLLEQVLGVLVDVLLVVGDEGLGDGLADGVDLRGVAAAGNANADVEVGKLVKADDEEGLVDLGFAVSIAVPWGVVLFDFPARWLCLDIQCSKVFGH